MKGLAGRVLLSLSIVPLTVGQNLAQSKSTHEACTADAECKSGYCVTLKDGNKKCSTCSQSDLNGYTGKVDESCKNKSGGVLAFSDVKQEFANDTERDVNYNALSERLAACKSCLSARETREDKCWEDGDAGHRDQISNMKEAVYYLEQVMDTKKSRKLAYYCDDGKYKDTVEDIRDNCDRVDDGFKKYVSDNPTELSCSDLSDVVGDLVDCRETYDSLRSDCFKDGFSDPIAKRSDRVREMERVSKETLDKRKGAGTCR